MRVWPNKQATDLERRVFGMIDLTAIEEDEHALHRGLRHHLGLLDLDLHLGLLLAASGLLHSTAAFFQQLGKSV